MTGHQPTEDDLLMDLIKTNRSTDGDTITRQQYKRHGDHNPWQAVNRFGSWREARAAAGVFREETGKKQFTDKEILKDLKKVNQKIEGLMTVEDYKKHGNISISLIYNRFDSFPTARSKAYNI